MNRISKKVSETVGVQGLSALHVEQCEFRGLEAFVSGGQTGADRAALDLAIRFGFPYSGWCPKGRLAEDGPLGGQYQLRETPSKSYLQRTGWNARDSDGTVILTLSQNLSGGSRRTAEFAKKLGKPVLHLPRAGDYAPALRLTRFVQEHGIRRLNVAGSRESKEPGIYRWSIGLLEEVFFWGISHPNYLGGPGEG